MTPEQQRIALCEWAGWKRVKHSDHWQCENEWSRQLPDTDSLDVLHEMEKRLKPSQCRRYVSEIWSAMCAKATPEECELGLFHAPAAQRREALLKTLNLWKT